MVNEKTAPAESRLGVHSFNTVHQSDIVHFQVLRLRDSFFLWLSCSPCIQQLAVAMPPAGAGGAAVSSLLLNKGSNGASDQLAAKLAWRTGKQVFVSCNLNLEDAALRKAVESRVVEEMKERTDQF